MIVPPPVRPGDVIAVVAPSSPFEAHLGFRGLAFLRERYEVVFDRAMFSRDGYLAGGDERRRDELSRAMEHPRARAILAARGGYGASRFVHALDWSKLREAPKWVVGFSDITAIHVELTRVGVASMHAPHLTSLGRSDARTRESLVDALENPSRTRTFDELAPLANGEAEGVLAGGNLTLLHAAATAGRLALPDRTILFIEDVTERPYRIDRMLTTLALGGHLDRVAGVVAGDFTSCDPGADGVTIDRVLAERLAELGVPVAKGLRAGHGEWNEPLVLGATARLSVASSRASLSLSLPSA